MVLIYLVWLNARNWKMGGATIRITADKIKE